MFPRESHSHASPIPTRVTLPHCANKEEDGWRVSALYITLNQNQKRKENCSTHFKRTLSAVIASGLLFLSYRVLAFPLIHWNTPWPFVSLNTISHTPVAVTTMTKKKMCMLNTSLRFKSVYQSASRVLKTHPSLSSKKCLGVLLLWKYILGHHRVLVIAREGSAYTVHSQEPET